MLDIRFFHKTLKVAACTIVAAVPSCFIIYLAAKISGNSPLGPGPYYSVAVVIYGLIPLSISIAGDSLRCGLNAFMPANLRIELDEFSQEEIAVFLATGGILFLVGKIL